VVDSTAGGGNTVNFSHTPLGVQLIDPASGVELLRLENEATQIGLSPDGAWLFATGWSNLNTLEAPWTQVYQADHLTPVAQIDQGRLAETARIDGSPVLASYYPDASGVTLSVVDADTFEPLARWWVPGYAEWLPRP
jgi:hypothetical protein